VDGHAQWVPKKFYQAVLNTSGDSDGTPPDGSPITAPFSY
jgi:hypothetical protein